MTAFYPCNSKHIKMLNTLAAYSASHLTHFKCFVSTLLKQKILTLLLTKAYLYTCKQNAKIQMSKSITRRAKKKIHWNTLKVVFVCVLVSVCQPKVFVCDMHPCMYMISNGLICRYLRDATVLSTCSRKTV